MFFSPAKFWDGDLNVYYLIWGIFIGGINNNVFVMSKSFISNRNLQIDNAGV